MLPFVQNLIIQTLEEIVKTDILMLQFFMNIFNNENKPSTMSET